jgi:squalene cyclase
MRYKPNSAALPHLTTTRHFQIIFKSYTESCTRSKQGYNGSQLWDTAFAVQAIAATQLGDQLGDSLARAGSFLEATQV